MTAAGAGSGSSLQGFAGIAGGVGDSIVGLRDQFAGASALRDQARFRERAAEQEAQDRAALGRQEFDEALLRVTQLRREATLLEEVGVRNALAFRAEGQRIVGQIEARTAASGIRFSGSAAEVAAAAAGAAEFAANEELVETGRQANALLFEADQLRQTAAQRLVASRIGAQTALTQGQFEAASIRARTPSTFEILGSAVRPLRDLPTAVNETLLTFRAEREHQEIARREETIDAGASTLGFLSPAGQIT